LGVPVTVEATDGDHAVKLFSSGGFDLVLTSWNLEGKNGLQLLSEIRQRDRNVPVVMVTGEADRPSVLAAIQAGVSDYLVKPFTADALREKLEKYCC